MHRREKAAVVKEEAVYKEYQRVSAGAAVTYNAAVLKAEADAAKAIAEANNGEWAKA